MQSKLTSLASLARRVVLCESKSDRYMVDISISRRARVGALSRCSRYSDKAKRSGLLLLLRCAFRIECVEARARGSSCVICPSLCRVFLVWVSLSTRPRASLELDENGEVTDSRAVFFLSASPRHAFLWPDDIFYTGISTLDRERGTVPPAL